MFNVFKNVMNKSHQFTEEELKKFNSFMFCRWLSGTFDTLKIAQCINLNYSIPDELQLKLAQYALNGRKRFIPFPKALKMNEEYENNLKYISEYYNVSLDKAKMYLELMSKEEFEYIKYQINTKRQAFKNGN